MKLAASLDGKTALENGCSQWITGPAARQDGHRWRARACAILSGIGTVRADDPQLTFREGAADRPQPWRVVLSRTGRLPAQARLFTDEHKDRTLVLPGPDLTTALRELAGRGIVTVLIEGGGQVLGQAFAERVVDELCWYVAPRLCGAGVPVLGNAEWAASVALEGVSVEVLEDNLCIHARPVWPALAQEEKR